MKIRLLLFLFCFSSVVSGISSAVHADSSIDLFEESPPVDPPLLFDESVVDPEHILRLNLRQYQSSLPITDTHFTIEMTDGDGKWTRTLKYMGDSGVLELDLPTSVWSIILKGDRLDTPGKDYYYKMDVYLSADTNMTVNLLSAGSVEGMVYTGAELREVVEGAILKFDCNADYIRPGEMTTDSFGSFENEWMPVGKCKIYAKNGKQIGSEDVVISPGDLSSNVQIILDKKAALNGDDFYVILLAVAAMLFLIYLLMRRRMSKVVATSEKSATREKEERVISKRAQDLMQTMNEREKKVVQYLLDNGGRSTQNKICRGTFIPKTSLSRCIRLLEQKRIIAVERFQNIVKIELTAWFMDKDETGQK